jgi:hypothetical protein
MEITITELVLFTWAIVATGFAYQYKERFDSLSFIFNKMLADDDARNEMVTKFKQWKEARNGR